MNIRKLIKETIEGVLNEAPLSFMDFGPNIGLVIQKPSSEQIWLNFFDFKNKKCVGVATVRKLESGVWHLNTVAGEKGFGPIIYKSAMMAVYPDSVCADRINNSQAAINIWHKFFTNSGELKKIPISQNNPLYKDYGDENINLFLNILYSRPASSWFKKMIAKGEYLASETQLDASSIRNICSTYFKGRYQER